jgi:hypothetical protein
MVGTSASGNRTAVYKGPVCSGHTSKGAPCRAPAMTNGKCRVHGGATPTGWNSPHWRNGRYSKYLPKGLAVMVDEALKDPDRHSMDQELALVDTRMGQVLSRMDRPDSASIWGQLRAANERFNDASAHKKVPEMHAAMDAIQRLISEGAAEGSDWSEIRSLIDQRRTLVESEERRMVTSGKAVPADQVMNIIATIRSIILDEVTDPAQRRRISERITSLAGTRKLPVRAGALARTEVEP